MSVERFTEEDFKETPAPKQKKTRAPRASPRTSIIPKACKLNVTNAKIDGIYSELKRLQLSLHVHAIGVLLRVFLEMSVDDYLVNRVEAKLTYYDSKNNRHIEKKLAAKVKEVIQHMVANGASERDFRGVLAGFHDDQHPFSIDTLHAYIHNRFFTPTEGNLTTGWDNAQRFFETLWA